MPAGPRQPGTCRTGSGPADWRYLGGRTTLESERQWLTDRAAARSVTRNQVVIARRGHRKPPMYSWRVGGSMASFILRRLFISFFVLLGATFIVYVLVANAGDPREALLESTDPGKANKIAAMTRNLSLDVPVIPRYLAWLRGALGCFVGNCDLGNTASGAPVSGGLAVAMGATLRLVVFALLIAIVVGVSIGMITALRQYSGLDYSVTFLAFLFFSLPVFWIAVLMKQFLAIKFNSWLKDPIIATWVIVVSALLLGLIASAVVGGNRRS